jgi:hypothetical protein
MAAMPSLWGRTVAWTFWTRNVRAQLVVGNVVHRPLLPSQNALDPYR